MLSKNIIEKNEICNLIPHKGIMCLLDEVTQWDDKHIVCYSNTHQDKNNPLRNKDILPVSALIEYGAQAMAIHGGLLALVSNEKMQEGYLASLRDVTLEQGDVSTIDIALCIEAEQKMVSGGSMVYIFSVKAGEKLLASGRATVVAIFHD